jgi:hypothetical protein
MPGDIVISAENIPSDKILATHALRSRATSFRRMADHIATYLTKRRTTISTTKEGNEAPYRFRHRAGGEVDVKLSWKKVVEKPAPEQKEEFSHDGVTDDGNIIYDGKLCARDLREPSYGSYRLVATGQRVCIYTSDQAPYDAFPIVRHYSFRYLGFFKELVRPAYYNPPFSRDILADYYIVSRMLRERPRTRGIILDVRDNRGGQDGEWFLDWYAPAAYTDVFTRIPQLADYADQAFRERVVNLGGNDEDWLPWYQKQVAKGRPGEPVKRLYQCSDSSCGEERRLTPAHGLIAAPVALLVGPNTGSAAAHFALIFDENDFGPLIGDVTAASFTVYRLEFPVKTRRGLDLGKMLFALTSEMSGKTGTSIEGQTPHIDYPVERTFERAALWDEDLINAAIKAFKAYPFPKRTTPLGP